MKLVVVLSRFPYPLEKGDKLRAYHQLKELSLQHEIILCSLTDQKIDPAWIKEINNFCSEVHLFRLKKPLLYWNTIKQFFSNRPYQIGYFYQRKIHRELVQIIQKKEPDHIYCQLIRTAEYVKDIHNVPKTLDYMDALSKGMLRRAEIAKGIKKQLFLIEGKRLAEYENRIFDYFNHHVIISTQDRDLIGHPQSSEIEIIENGIDQSFIDYKSNDKKEFDLVFTGNMNYPPNVECAEYIVNTIYPKLKALHPQLCILLSGANPHQRVLDLAENGQVIVTGWVEDIKTSYAKGKLFVAPLFIGTGLQNKLLEAMAMGLPCITTPLANNALGAVDNSSILIAKDSDEFVEKINALLSDSNLMSSVSKQGKKFVSSEFDWKKSIEKLTTVMRLN